mmetsp:Transcript_11986/g.25533  ORF Transcript_11986/g.25533 Transcript_11986/m.25533 type:complete len:267 (-) Transcript_11986:55-855(-)
MTTAARPTWVAAKGHEDQGGAGMFGAGYRGNAQPGHLTLKERAEGQDAAGELKGRDLKRELLEKEAKHFADKPNLLASKQIKMEQRIKVPGVIDDAFAAAGELVPRDADADADFSDEDEEEEDYKAVAGVGAGAGREAGATTTTSAASDDNDDESDSDDDDDDDDDEAELLAELERIKQERAEEKARQEDLARQEREDGMRDEVLHGNPLLQLDQQGGDEFAVKRRWDDDVVFRNQTRNAPKKQKRFINDTIRSDFHKRFLNKYIH